jgi:hypothetical protein
MSQQVECVAVGVSPNGDQSSQHSGATGLRQMESLLHSWSTGSGKCVPGTKDCKTALGANIYFSFGLHAPKVQIRLA